MLRYRAGGLLPPLLLIAQTLCLATLQVPRVVAEEPTRFVHRQWTTDDGLPVGGVTDVVQGDDGWLWIGTLDGLLRFDGHQLTRISVAEEPALGSNRVERLLLDPHGHLWILSEAGHLARMADEVFRTLETADEQPAARGGSAFTWSNGSLWTASAHGLFRAEGDRLVPGPAELADRQITAVCASSLGGVWFATMDGAIGRAARSDAVTADGWTVQWRPESWAHPDGIYTSVIDLTESRDGALWIGSTEGLYRAEASPAYRTPERQTWTPASTCPAPSFHWFESEDRRFVCSTAPEGTQWHAEDATLFRAGREVHRLADAEHLERLQRLAFDHEGALWLATNTRGLHALAPARVQVIGPPEGLPDRNVYPVHQDRAGAIWIGDWQGGLSRLVDGELQVIRPRAAHLATLSIFDDPGTDRVLVGTLNGFSPFDDREDEPVLEGSNPCVEGRDVRALMRHRGDRLLAGTSNGLCVSRPGDPLGDRWHFRNAAGTEGHDVRVLHESANGDVWFGTAGRGLGRWRPDGSVLRIGTRQGLPADGVRAIHEDERGLLWIGTEGGGLVRLDPSAVDGPSPPHLEIAQRRHGLLDDGIHHIIEDDAGWFWMSTNRGVFRVRRRELEQLFEGSRQQLDTVVYNEADGMRDREGNGGVDAAGLQARDGTIWFPTQDGVAIFDPERLRAEGEPPPVHLLAVHSAGKPVAMPKPRDPAEILELAASQRDFDVTYTAISLRGADHVRFRYRLEGFDDTWVDAASRRRAFYTHVPPGRYVFHVQARGPDGVWNLGGARLALHIAPFPWETWWAQGGAALLALLLIWGAVRTRERRQGEVRRQLEVLVEERTRQLTRERDTVAQQAERLAALDQARSHFFANVSHEFRTPLTLTLGPLRDLLAGRFGRLNPEIRRQAESMRANAARLLSLVNQLLDTSRMESGGMELAVQHNDLVAFVSAVSDRFLAAAEARRLSFEIDLPEAPVRLWFDPEQLDKVLANLLANAFKFTPASGAVHVRVWTEDDGDRAFIQVRDTGKGVSEADLPRLFERYFQTGETTARQAGTGLGLALAHDLVHLHGGTLLAESREGKGSTFTIVLQSGHEHLSAHIVCDREDPALGESSSAVSPIAFRSSIVAGEAFDTLDEWPSGELQAIARPDDEETSTEPSSDDVTTVLVVDDHPGLRDYVRRCLEPSYRVLAASNGADALASAQLYVPDLIVSDVMMPLPPDADDDAPADGLELCRILKNDPNLDFVPVILLTARASIEDKLAGLDTGADDYLPKPFDARELVARVDNLIRQRHRLRERFSAAAHDLPKVGLPIAEGFQPSRDDLQWMERVQREIESGFPDEEFSVEVLANRMAVHRSGLHRRLRRLTGLTPVRLISRWRLERAAALLRNDLGNVSEAAYAVGFRSVEHFSRSFRKQFGQAPSAYRQLGVPRTTISG